jgi:hypothetical protein
MGTIRPYGNLVNHILGMFFVSFHLESLHPLIEGRYLYSGDFERNLVVRSYTLASGLNIFICETVALGPSIQYS